MTKKKKNVNLVNGIYIHLVVKLPIQLFEWNVTSFIVGVSWIMQLFTLLPQASTGLSVHVLMIHYFEQGRQIWEGL